MDKKWGPWILHDDNGIPLSIGPENVVQVEYRRDGKISCELLASELDWHCPGDPVAAYRVKKPRGLTILENLINDLPAPVGPKVDA